MGIFKYKTENGWEYAETPAAVKYTEQNLTDEQKAQVKANLGISENGGETHYTTEFTLKFTDWVSASSFIGENGVSYNGICTYVHSTLFNPCSVNKYYHPTLIVDLADSATLEQRKAAETACLYCLEGSGFDSSPVDGLYHPFYYFVCTSDSAPTVDIPLSIMYIK